MDNKIKVVISGIYYPLAMMTYFIRAFERRNDIELVTAGPFTGSWIPWKGGMNLPVKYVKSPTIPLPKDFISVSPPPAIIQNRLPWIPDLWLQIDAGWHLSSKPKATIVGHVQTDPHCTKSFYEVPIKYSDVNFCMQQAYIQPGEQYLPYAFDPTIHYPENRPQIYDVCLSGLQYENRVRLVNELRRRGRNVYSDIGNIFDEYRILYNQSRVAINWSSLLDLTARVFESFGMARPLVCNRVPDLANFFVENDHYLGFSNLDEGVKQVERCLNDPTMAEEMAGAAHRKVVAGHTWDHRIQQILEVCKLI